MEDMKRERDDVITYFLRICLLFPSSCYLFLRDERVSLPVSGAERNDAAMNEPEGIMT